MKQQSHIDRLYLSVKDMVEHRKTKLEQQYWLYQLNKDVEELEKWITEREVVASSTELGHDLEDVTVSDHNSNISFSFTPNNILQSSQTDIVWGPATLPPPTFTGPLGAVVIKHYIVKNVFILHEKPY